MGSAAWALPVAGAVALAPLAERPLLGAIGLAAASAVALAIATARRIGLGGLWLAVLAGSILAGEMSAIGFGGQSGRILWADAVLGLGLVVAVLRGRLTLAAPRAPFLVALLALVAWSGIGLLVAPDVLTGIAELKEWIVAWLAGAAAAAWATDARRARQLLVAVVVTGALIGAAMFWVAWRHPLGMVLAVMLKLVDLPWGRSNYLAGLLILAFPIALGLIGGARGMGRLGIAVCLGALGLGLVVSASKGAIVSLLVAVAITYGFTRGGSRAARVALLVLLAAGVLGYLMSPLKQVLSYRLAEGALEYSAGERMDLYGLAWKAFATHPLLGVGLNNFSVISNALHGLDTVPHNLELGFLAELGLPGLVLALAWIFTLGRSAWRVGSAARAPAERAMGLGLWAAWLAFVLHNQMESTIYGEQFKLLLMLAAAATWRLEVAARDRDRVAARSTA
jgi:hypothetical protein